MMGIFTKDRKAENIQRQRGESHGKGGGKAKQHLALPEAGRDKEGFSPRAFRGSTVLPIP